MTARVRKIATPAWLRNLSAASLHHNLFPLEKLLLNSLFYPSSAFDGDPVKFLARAFHSFIYADYGCSEEEFLQALANPGFLGYEVIATRSVTAQELNWPELPTYLDGSSAHGELQVIKGLGWIKQPFCTWTVFQRCDDRPPSYGPSRFSLLYLCADGAATYQALYVSNSIAPKAIAIIQPGHCFGGNWTNFDDPNQILARTIAANPAGKPELLLYGGNGSRDYYRKPCWPEYSEHLCFLDKRDRGTIGVWRLNPDEK